MRKLLALGYKGTREYLHGTDFFNALTALAQEITGDPAAFVDRLTFRHFAKMACEVTTSQPADLSRLIGQARFRSPQAGGHVDAWLVETDTSVSARQPFDEEELLADASLDESGRSAQLPAPSKYTPIEDVIILTKYLNNAVSPTVDGKWVFGQIDLLEPLTGNYRSLDIRMKGLTANRFSVNDIWVDGRRIGVVRFIVGAP